MTPTEIQRYLEPYIAKIGLSLCEKLNVYLELLLKWNARTNLTAIRDPAEIVRRHFGESLFAAGHLGECVTLLDFGSGAGFPGVPMQLLRPDLQITLAESQGKKSAFLREVVRALDLQTEVWSARVDAMPVTRRFDVVVMRAVDRMEIAVAEAVDRAQGELMILGSSSMHYPELLGLAHHVMPLPGANDGVLLIAKR